MKQFLIVVCLSMFFSGCARPPSKTTSEQVDAQMGKDTLKSFRQENPGVVIAWQGKLWVIDPAFPKPEEIYTLDSGEAPVDQTFYTFLLSPDAAYVVWYTPQKGLLRLKLGEHKTTTVYQPSLWFNTHPYFVFDPQSPHLVYFVAEDGKVLVSADLETNKITQLPVPYPFGTQFRISPDGDRFVFIAGYGQSRGVPSYLFMDAQGGSRKFNGSSEVNERNVVAWTSDSLGVVMLKNHKTLHYLPFAEGGVEEDRFSLSASSSAYIVDIQTKYSYVWVVDSDHIWHRLDGEARTETARIPPTVAAELNQPVFYPWGEDGFLMEEVLGDNDIQFSRLWLSDFKGIKKMLMGRYREVQITTNTPKI